MPMSLANEQQLFPSLTPFLYMPDLPHSPLICSIFCNFQTYNPQWFFLKSSWSSRPPPPRTIVPPPPLPNKNVAAVPHDPVLRLSPFSFGLFFVAFPLWPKTTPVCPEPPRTLDKSPRPDYQQNLPPIPLYLFFYLPFSSPLPVPS